MEAGALRAPGGRSLGERSPASRLADSVFRRGLTALAALILALIAFFFVKLAIESNPVFSKYGVLNFIFSNEWVPSQGQFGALPLVVGTLISSAIALVIGVPVAVATATGTPITSAIAELMSVPTTSGSAP